MSRIKKILIANRGEIACRVIHTARAMGVSTVAVYSDADAGALHVEMADQAVRIGPAPVSESYLQGEAIINAAVATGADAIHPGYGFLSENPEFVEAVTGAGLIFVGPPAPAIRAMGLKDAAKALMEKAGVPVVPGYHGADQDAALLAKEAAKIGYPVLIKARAGGGGKGMRLVERAEDFAEALASAAREGQASFGDPAVLIEKYITSPRHIEIQVFADAHGNVVHLFERDCSLQRRHQKVIEEAPAPDMPVEVRAAMGQAAVEAARAIGYVGAGTVEFIVDGSGPLRPDGFWFMEMNTRLQVEHPVTEAITGLDLVELQVRVAGGEALPFEQDDLSINGHAFEARLYAEDAAAGFLPSTGRLDLLKFPNGTSFERGVLRIDAGVRTGDEITPHYDPMIAKVIVHGPDRATALAQLTRGLNSTEVVGLTTNLGFLARLSEQPDFGSGQVDTGLIERHFSDLTQSAEPPLFVLAAALYTALGLDRSGTDPWHVLSGWRAWGEANHNVRFEHAGTVSEHRVALRPDGISFAGKKAKITPLGTGLTLCIDDVTMTLGVHKAAERITVFDGAEGFVFTLPDPLVGQAGTEANADMILAPMPGLVSAVMAEPGKRVSEGDALITLEAMKMEHTLRALRDGVIAEIMATTGDQVTDGAVLLTLESVDD